MTFVKVNPKKRRHGHPRRRPHRHSNFWTTPFDNLINELANNAADGSCNHTTHSRPATNVRELDDSFILDVAVPGLTKKDIAIDVEKDQLTISADKTVEVKEGEKVTRCEFNFNQFKRSFTLPETVDTQKIKASFKNGVLTIELTKKEEAKEQPPRTIKIQ